MASELSWRSGATGSTVYATIRSVARTYWNGSALEALTVANWGNYDITMPETPASSYFYVGDWPAALTTVGWYYVDVFLQAAASPAISDGILGTMLGYWDGTSFVPGSDIMASLNAISAVKRGVALTSFPFLMTLNRTPVTGLTVAVTIRKDSGSFAAATNSPATEIGNGIYSITTTAAEMSASIVTLRMTATGADDLVITIPVGS